MCKNKSNKTANPLKFGQQLLGLPLDYEIQSWKSLH